MIRSRLLMLVLALASCISFAATAANPPPLPRPRITGPAQTVASSPLTLRFSFPPIGGNRQNYWPLWAWNQYWYCPQGKDSKPTEISLQAEPWAGQDKICTKDDNRYLGLTLHDTGDVILVPKQGGIPAAGTWYVRTRLVWWLPHEPKVAPRPGPWSAWHRVVVAMHVKDAPNVAPKILAPTANQMFVNRSAQVTLAPGRPRPDSARWEYVLEWQRADYHTRGDNLVWRRTHPGNFPRVENIATPMKSWTAPTELRALPETQGTSSARIDYAVLHPTRPDSSFQYQFRAREHIRGSKAYGPWSQWRSFVVSHNGTGTQHRTQPLKLPMRPLPGHASGNRAPLKLPARSGHGH